MVELFRAVSQAISQGVWIQKEQLETHSYRHLRCWDLLGESINLQMRMPRNPAIKNKLVLNFIESG